MEPRWGVVGLITPWKQHWPGSSAVKLAYAWTLECTAVIKSPRRKMELAASKPSGRRLEKRSTRQQRASRHVRTSIQWTGADVGRGADGPQNTRHLEDLLPPVPVVGKGRPPGAAAAANAEARGS